MIIDLCIAISLIYIYITPILHGLRKSCKSAFEVKQTIPLPDMYKDAWALVELLYFDLPSLHFYVYTCNLNDIDFTSNCRTFLLA